MLEKLGKEDFERLKNTKFRLFDDVGAFVELELVDVTDEMVHLNDAAERFSLYFHLPGTQLLPQRIYRMEHDELGSLELFIVPLGREGEGFSYQAVFSRLKENA